MVKLEMLRFYLFNHLSMKYDLILETPSRARIQQLEEKHRKKGDRFRISYLKPHVYKIAAAALQEVSAYALPVTPQEQSRATDRARILLIGKFHS
jgi:hypothetical protein